MRICPSCNALSLSSLRLALLPVTCTECSSVAGPVGLIDMLYNLVGVFLLAAVVIWGVVGGDNLVLILAPLIVVFHFLLRGMLLPLESKSSNSP